MNIYLHFSKFKYNFLAEDWRRLYNEELHNFYTSPNIIRVTKSRMVTDKACSTYWNDEKCIKYFGWKPKDKKSLGRTRRRWEDNIRMDLMEIGWEGVDFIHLAKDRDNWLALVSK
jgi:hypothetical protein